jgi:hypothetical protein
MANARAKGRVAIAAMCAITTMASSAAAQEIQLTGPLCGAPAARARRSVEWATWLAGGGSWGAGEKARPSVATGSELTFSSVTLAPASLELRWGPWAQIGTDFVGSRGEGGLAVALSDVMVGPVGFAGLRLGGGTGDDASGKRPHVVGTLFVGGRTAAHSARACATARRLDALEAGARIFVGLRRTLDGPPATWATVGAEFDLTHVF